MTNRVDVEEIEATRSEKFLACVLAAFLLIGSIWFYVKLDDFVRDVDGAPPRTVAEKAAFTRAEKAARSLADRSSEAASARAQLESDREAYRTELDAGRPAPALETKYRESEARLARAEQAEKAASAEDRAATAAAKPHYKTYGKRSHKAEVKQAWITALLRFGFIVAWFAVSLRLVSRMRRAQSRFVPLGFAAVGTGVVTALVFATDYITDYINPLDLGPIVLSVVGAATTIGAFIGLQRWLAQRVPGRRVRSGECPYCGFPVRAGTHCEGCGREVIAPCASCSEPRRVGSPHCATCGRA